MIDFVVVVQAIVAGMILWCAKAEEGFDRAGFSLLAATAALMTVRRVTAQFDSLVTADRVVLPAVITFVFFAAAAFFVIERLRRLREVGRPLWRRMLWPTSLPTASICFAVVCLCDWMPARSSWNGAHMAELTFETALREVGAGANPMLAAERLRWDCTRAIEQLAVQAVADPKNPAYYRNKLRAIRDAADKEIYR